MLKVPDFTEFDLRYLKENGNLTERERTLLELRNKQISLEERAEIMNMSVSTVSRTVKKLKNKCEKLGIVMSASCIWAFALPGVLALTRT